MMHDPSHPGEVIKHDCIEASQLTVTDAADGLGVSRKALRFAMKPHSKDETPADRQRGHRGNELAL